MPRMDCHPRLFSVLCNNLLRRFVLYQEKYYLCKMIMRKLLYIAPLVAALLTSCIGGVDFSRRGDEENIIATVDEAVLMRDELQRALPQGLEGADSATFAHMYVDNWVLNQLKMARADEVLSSSSEDIERLVEGYRQSLIMRSLDQYYIDNAIDFEITDQQITSYYRSHSALFKLDHHKVRGFVVKVPRQFRNTTTLQQALVRASESGSSEELVALAEKHSLSLVDLSAAWVSYSDFLSNLPTVRSRDYSSLLQKSGAQQLSGDDAIFHFVIVDVARKGETAPLVCVEDDIRRSLYAERRAEIVKGYEAELRREAFAAGRVMVADSAAMRSMSYIPEVVEEPVGQVATIEEEILEEDIQVESADSTLVK